MKTRIFMLAVLLTAATCIQAQYNADYYHRVGDTVYTQSEIGYYSWWDFDRLMQDREIFNIQNTVLTGRVVISQYFTPTPLKLVGLAGCPFSLYDSTPLPEYFYLFEKENENLVFKDRLQWRPNEPHRTLILPYNYDDDSFVVDSCCGWYPRTKALPLHEHYFDTAIYVQDSFYVGASFSSDYIGNSVTVLYGTAGNPTSWTGRPCDDQDAPLVTPNGPFAYCGGTSPIRYLTCNDPAIDTNPSGDYYWSVSNIMQYFLLVYPLIQIDTTVPPTFLCEPVQNFQASVLDTGSGCVFFTWDDFLHYTYCEVQYYAIQQGFPSAVDTVVSGANMLHLCGLDTMMTYYARIRAFCDTSKIETDWSNWVSFSFPHTDPPSPPDPPQGVAEPSVLDQFTHVLPNPAADKVTVMSELGLRRIEIYNARGILVYSEPVGYSQATIDLRGWPAGQYMMLIETRQGKTAKRLVVAR